MSRRTKGKMDFGRRAGGEKVMNDGQLWARWVARPLGRRSRCIVLPYGHDHHQDNCMRASEVSRYARTLVRSMHVLSLLGFRHLQLIIGLKARLASRVDCVTTSMQCADRGRTQRPTHPRTVHTEHHHLAGTFTC